MLRLAIASCCKLWQNPTDHAWRDLVKESRRPDWLVLLGDNIYLKKRHERAIEARLIRPRKYLTREYERLFADPSFRALVGDGTGKTATRLLATWDDHDFAGDDVNGAEVPGIGYRDETRAVFLKYLAGAVGARSEVYCGLTPAPGVRVILTDGRYYRTAPGAGVPTMFGPTQEGWILGELERPEPLKIIASGSCLGPRAKKRYKQGWDLYPAWLEQFREAVVRHHAAGRRHLMVSGDIHRNRIVDHADTAAALPLIEVISSGAGRRKKNWNPWSTPLANYGLVDLLPSSIDIELKGNLPRDRRSASVALDDWTVLER